MSKGRQSESGREEAASSRSSPGRDPADSSRRDFLVRCCQGASAAFIPAGLRGLAFPFAYASDSPSLPSSGSDFHLHPHYRAQLPPGGHAAQDAGGPGRLRHREISRSDCCHSGGVECGLYRGLRRTCARWRETLAPDFSGASFRPVESRVVRPGPAVEIRQNKFAREPAAGEGRLSRGNCGPR